MSANFEIARSGRAIHLLADGKLRLQLPLDTGGRYRALVADAATAQRLVAKLEIWPGTGVLPAGGGLLGAMTVAENFRLALRYGAEDEAGGLVELEADLAVALALCGIAPEQAIRLGRERPMNIERRQRWVLGFARWLMRPPELLVLDRACSGLARRDADALIALQSIYHSRHPFRPVLFVDLDSHELPDLPGCRNTAFLVESVETS